MDRIEVELHSGHGDLKGPGLRPKECAGADLEALGLS